MTILTVTPNPAIDRTLIVPGFTDNGVYRTDDYIIAAGAKGVNVARVIRTFGHDTLCAGMIGGYSGRLFSELAAQDGLQGRWTQIAGETRTCTIISNPTTGRATVVNETGPHTDAEDWARFHADVLSAAECDTVCLCGSLPSGSPVAAYAALISALVGQGKSVWVDSSGAALKAAAAVTGVNIKVNKHEIAAVTGQTVSDALSARAAAETLQSRTHGMVVVTLGKQGAIMLHGSAVFLAESPPVQVASAVGSGDAFFGGLLVGLQASHETALRQAVAAGAANATTYGGGSFPQDTFERLLMQVKIVHLN